MKKLLYIFLVLTLLGFDKGNNTLVNEPSIIIEKTIVDEWFEAYSTLKAFPEAYGNVATITGGRGGNVYHVTNLNGDYSAGSLLWAVTQPRPATVVFDVSGVINMGSNFFIVQGFGFNYSRANSSVRRYNHNF